MQRAILNGKYELYLPEHRANREQWYEEFGWEKIRIDEMVNTITSNDTVFDIGTEEGEISAIIAKYTDCNMVMFEPNEKVYGCIKAIWEANGLRQPLDFWPGFLADKSITTVGKKMLTFDWMNENIDPAHGFSQLCEENPTTLKITMDDYCSGSGLYPTVITMDVEGSEFIVLKGAEKILREKKPIIFLSVHEVMMWQNYGHEVKDMLIFMREFGYEWQCIDYGLHENSVTFYPR